MWNGFQQGILSENAILIQIPYFIEQIQQVSQKQKCH